MEGWRSPERRERGAYEELRYDVEQEANRVVVLILSDVSDGT